MNKTAKILAAGLTTVALAGGIGAGIASADPSTPTPGPSATASPTPGSSPSADREARRAAKKHRPLLGRALHGEVTLSGPKHRVVDFQRGEVEKVSNTSITVRSKDGFTATYVVDDKTKVHEKKQPGTIATVKTGDRVRVVATKNGATLTANRIGDHGTR